MSLSARMRKITKAKSQPKPEMVMFQARLQESLYDALIRQLSRDGSYMQDFLEAAVREYLKENGQGANA